jgi:hypothetical protein
MSDLFPFVCRRQIDIFFNDLSGFAFRHADSIDSTEASSDQSMAGDFAQELV